MVDQIFKLIQDLSVNELIVLRNRLEMDNDSFMKMIEKIIGQKDLMSISYWEIDPGEKKIACIKLIREATGLGLKESKHIADGDAYLKVAGWSYSKKQKFYNDLIANGSEVVANDYKMGVAYY